MHKNGNSHSFSLQDLMALDSMSQRGPNFHRLQIYTRCLQEIINDSDTFGPLLQEIKVSTVHYVWTAPLSLQGKGSIAHLCWAEVLEPFYDKGGGVQ